MLGRLTTQSERAPCLSFMLNLMKTLDWVGPGVLLLLHINTHAGIPALALGAAVIPVGDLVIGTSITVALVDASGAVVGQVTVLVTAARRLTQATTGEQAVIAGDSEAFRRLQQQQQQVEIYVSDLVVPLECTLAESALLLRAAPWSIYRGYW